MTETLHGVSCRVCGNRALQPILSLGNQPLANALPTKQDLKEPEPRYPLDVVLCEPCGLLQITETVPPEVLFRDYLYFSSFSDTLLQHARSNVERLIRERNLGPDSLVVELASNDGYLLQYFVQAGIPVLGIEPARNVAQVAEERGVPTLPEFFGASLAQSLRAQGIQADVVIGNNVLAHVADLNGFVQGIATLLRPGGKAQIEAPYALDMIERCEFDTIYHEHLCYYSLTSLQTLFARHGMAISDVEHLDIHGGSLRVSAVHAPGPGPSNAVTSMLQHELEWGVSQSRPYANFSSQVQSIENSLRSMLANLDREGKSVAAYGAAAKGTVLLNAFDLGTNAIKFVVDRSTYKQGRYVPGVRIPICAPERLLTEKPDYVLLLAWNFADEILHQQAEYRQAGGRFIIPIPEPRIV
jgi:SAM-dependent methyltransferase